MHCQMRTTIDVPDDLLKRIRPILADRQMTLRELVINAIERAIKTPPVSFRLRDSLVGYAGDDGGVSSELIDRAINETRMPSFRG